jgi:hypothetical protein
MALACEAKANLHPLAFYTIEFTSPFWHMGFTARRVGGIVIVPYNECRKLNVIWPLRLYQEGEIRDEVSRNCICNINAAGGHR